MSEKLKLVCAQCATVNQLPKERLNQNPVCGKCKVILHSNKPSEVNGTTLSQFISHSALPVLVDFWAPWCGPCKAFAPTFENFAKEYAKQHGQQVICLKLNAENDQAAGAQFNIRSIPTLALFRAGKEVDRISGAMNEQQLAQWVNSKS